MAHAYPWADLSSWEREDVLTGCFWAMYFPRMGHVDWNGGAVPQRKTRYQKRAE